MALQTDFGERTVNELELLFRNRSASLYGPGMIDGV